jgi:hypothetical protein
MAIIPGDARAHDIAGQFATEELALGDMRWAGAIRLEKATHAPGGLESTQGRAARPGSPLFKLDHRKRNSLSRATAALAMR